MRMTRGMWGIFFLIGIVSLLSAQVALETGSIRGVVTDPEGTPLPGVSVTASGPNLIGSISDVTKADGSFRLPSLPIGRYVVVASLAGFQITRREEVVVSVSMTTTINYQLKPSTLKEEVTVVATSPVVDIERTHVSMSIQTTEIQKLPVNRTLTNLVNLTAGAVGAVVRSTASSNNNYSLDGVTTQDPDTGGNTYTVQYDAMEEVELMTGALPAQVGMAAGTFVNVVTKSGGNEFHGQVQAFYSNESLVQFLFSEAERNALGLGKPAIPTLSMDLSGILGGPIIKDKLWFFADFAYQRTVNRSPLIPTTILGVSYNPYDMPETYDRIFLKLTTQLSKALRVSVVSSFELLNRPAWNWYWTAEYIPEECTIDYKNGLSFAQTGNLNWVLSSSTFLDLRVGAVQRFMPSYIRAGTEGKISYQDSYTGYIWNTNSRYDETYRRYTNQVAAQLTNFQDNLLGGNHQFQAGIDIGYQGAEFEWWRPGESMNWYYWNGNPYYWRGNYGLNGPHPTLGDGRINMSIMSGTKDMSSGDYSKIWRTSAYLQDSWTIKNRLTINAGVRYDRISGGFPEAKKGATAGIAPAIGASVLQPVYGINPYGELVAPEWKNALGWGAVSPRLGISYDLFGDGRTALKVSYSEYVQSMKGVYIESLHPFDLRSYTWNWWDMNNNQFPDAPPIDRYALYSGSPVDMIESYYRDKVGKNFKAEKYIDTAVGIQHELFRNFRVGLQYIHRTRVNTVEDVLWDRASGKYWYTYDRAPDWWVPFKTTVPAYKGFPAQDVTLYFVSNNAPYQNEFLAFANIPEAKKVYDGIDLSFDKRFANNWSLGGSINVSKSLGHFEGSQGHGSDFDNPNWWVNRYGRTGNDRPLIIKLYGSYSMPYNFVVSLILQHYDGTPFTRTVTVLPPAAWTAANNTLTRSYTINVEAPGPRRNYAIDNCDVRAEKEFTVGKIGKLGIYLDVYNVFGSRYNTVSLNPGGNWAPADANTAAGTFTASSSFGKVTGLTGQRQFKLSARFTF